MSAKKKIIAVVVLLVAIACTAAAVAFLSSGNDEGYSLNDDSPAENAGTIVEEQDTDQGDSYVAPDGSGAISRDDYDSDEEYEKALIDSGSPQTEVPREAVSEKQPEEEYDYGYYKYLITIYADYSAGEERVRGIAQELGGVWASDTFSWPSSEKRGRASAQIVFWNCDSKERLEAKCAELESYPEIYTAAVNTWAESMASNG